jgi:hypothetical protein
MNETDNDMLQNDNQDRNVSSECEKDEGTDCEKGHSNQ